MVRKLRGLLENYVSHPDTFVDAANRYTLISGTVTFSTSSLLLLFAEPFLAPFFLYQAGLGILVFIKPALRRIVKRETRLPVAAFCFVTPLIFWLLIGSQASLPLYIIAATASGMPFFRWQNMGSIALVCCAALAAFAVCSVWHPTPLITVPAGYEGYTQFVINGYLVGLMFLSVSLISGAFNASESRFRALRDRLMVERDRAREASRAREEFLAMISHEFRTPLSTLITATKVLRKRANMQHLRNELRAIEASSESILLFFQNALDHAQYSSGQFVPKLEHVNLNEIARHVVSVLSSGIEKKSLNVSITLSPSCPAVIVNDANLIRQLLLNFVSNALKYTDKGHIRIRFEATQSETQRGLRIEVEDTGMGISPDQKEQLFDPFIRNSKPSRGIEGIGLGLAICKRIVETLGGDIGVESTLGSGSLFWAQIPLVDIDESLQASSQSSDECLTGLKLLLVEDHEFNRRILKELFENEGMIVTDVDDPHAAMATIARTDFDVIVTDLFLRQASGVELAQRIRKHHGRIPIIALSASAREKDRADSLAAGIDQVLTKPLSIPEFRSAVTQSKEKRQAEEKTA